METKDGLSTPEYPGIRDSMPQVDLVIMGYGIWENFRPNVVFGRLQSDIRRIRARDAQAHIIWLGADARQRDDYALQTNERVIRYNDAMFAKIRDAGISDITTLNLFNITLNLHSYDGTHYGPGVNRLKSQILLQFIKDHLNREGKPDREE